MSASSFTSPRSYTPKHLADRILVSKAALEGERKQVTVLFADLRGSMELLADRDPEEARRLLDPVLERMMEAVHRYEGTVNQVMGDGVMALFGAPLAHEDHAVRACYAALDLQAAMRRYADEVRRAHGVALQVRVGLNSGDVVVRAIGSDLHMDYTAVGQTTHLASRVEQLATPGSVLLTTDTLRLAEGYVEVKPLGPVPIKGLVDSVPTARLLLLVNYRPEYRHDWGNKSYYTQIRLDPLAAEGADALLRALLGADPSLQPLSRVLIERTEGNPFFLEESVRDLAEAGVLAGERGAYRLARPLGGVQVPATVQAVLAARIDRLSPEDKGLLQTAAVVGKDVPFALLEALADRTEDDLRGAVARLQAAEFLYEAALFPDLEYTFKHALTHELAYGSLLQERRRAIHGRVVEAMERVYGDRLSEQVERLGHYAVRGELWEKAVGYLSQAAGKAMGRAALREAVACFDQALDALEHVPVTPASLDRSIDLRLSLRNALYLLGEHERTLENLRTAERLAIQRGDHVRLVRVLGYLSTHFVFTEVLDQARQYATRAVTLAETVKHPELEIEMVVRLAIVHLVSGEYARAVEVFRGLVPRVQEETPKPRLVGAILASVMTMNLLQRGDLQQATRVLERSLEICRAVDAAAVVPGVTSHLGLAYARAGRHAEARPLLQEAVEQEARGFEQSLHHVMLAEGHLLAGRVAEAGEVAERAHRRASERHVRGAEAWARRLLGEIAAQADGSGAERHFAEALALAEGLGMRPLAAHCHLGLARLHRRLGHDGPAEAHLTTATRLYRVMGMEFWLAEAGRAS